MFTQADLQSLCQRILSNQEILSDAHRHAGHLVHNNPANLHNCCAATLSYLLIDGLQVDLQPTSRALKLAYILEQKMGFTRVSPDQPLLVGDIGVVDDPPKKHRGFDQKPSDEIVDGDALDSLSAFTLPTHEFTGEGYVEPDPHNSRAHHIYLILNPAPDPTREHVVWIADNQQPMPHERDITGGNRSPTLYFLRLAAG